MRTPLHFALMALAGMFVLPFVGCNFTKSSPKWPDGTGPKVLVSFAPYACFVQNVAGDKAVVVPLMTEQGPHHTDMSVSGTSYIETADVFFVNGLGLDDGTASKLWKNSSNRNLRFVKVGDKLDKDLLIEGGCACCSGHDEATHDHKGDHDPHIWLSPKLAIKIVEIIRDELKAAAPQFASEYDANAAAYIAKLQKLHEDGRAMLREKQDKKIVTVHDSLGYFAQSFKLTIAGVIQKTPGQEPNPTQLADLIEACKKQKARVLAVEPQYTSRGSVETLKAELAKAGVLDPQIIELDPLETASQKDLTREWYEQQMQRNLSALDKVLK